jgi:hypothetical protein
VTSRRPLLALFSALGLAGLIGLLGLGTPAAAQAAAYPPASTGTFAVTAHPGTNRVTISGLGAKERATAIVAGHGAAPSVGPIKGTPATQTANLAVGKTDASGRITFKLVFAAGASGVYNVSVSTPDGRSESGSVTIPGKDGSSTAWGGARLALWIVWVAGIVVILGAIALLTSAVRRSHQR